MFLMHLETFERHNRQLLNLKCFTGSVMVMSFVPKKCGNCKLHVRLSSYIYQEVYSAVPVNKFFQTSEMYSARSFTFIHLPGSIFNSKR